MQLAERELHSALGERQLRLEELGADPELEAGTAARISELEAELAELARGEASSEAARLREAAAEAERRRAEAERALGPLGAAEDEALVALRRTTEMVERTRAEAQKASERRAALAGELAAVEAKLAAATVESEHEVLAAMVETGSGLERALSVALGERLRASVVGSIAEGVERIGGAQGATRTLIESGSPPAAGPPPVEGARRLLDLVEARGGAGRVVERLLADAWLVDDLAELPSGFTGLAVTVDGECYDGAAGELRQLPREGTDPALAARSEREELASRLRQREQTEERTKRDLEKAEEAHAAALARHDEAHAARREARRELDEASEEASRATWLAEQREQRDEGAGQTALRRTQLEAELAAERRHVEAADRAREARDRDREKLERRISLERETLPALGRAHRALVAVAERLAALAEKLAAPGEDGGGEIAAELRQCSEQEYGLQAELREVSQTLTTAEVEAAQLRDRRNEGSAELRRLGEVLDEELAPATSPLPEEERAEIEAKLARVARRREQIGPVNPLAEREYAEEREHVTELAEQRKDLEKAIAELRALVRRTDKEIAAAFEETLDSTARNFEEMVAELFPGGRGRLRRVEMGPRPLPDRPGAAAKDAVEDDEELDGAPADEDGGVEIEVTPAGKSTRRLSLLSGGEKSLVALAFVFAVLMARPCPFYILDEVEAALDDINLDRFLRLVRRFAERSQFVIVTHQKRTMDAADILYGVSMGGDGVTKVVSRRLPRDRDLSDAAEVPGADDPTAEAAA
jgi:chromosome segregation protein